jgi:hypothetical protein
MKYGKVKVEIHELLTSTVDGSGWSFERLGHLIPEVGALGTLWIGGWVGFSAGMKAVWRQEPLTYTGNGNPIPRPPNP